MRVYYYGCADQSGHYMHKPGMITDWKFLDTNPWGFAVDGGLLKGRKETYVLSHKDGWTALSFWDNSVDTRPGSNSNFLAEGDFTENQMREIAWKYFPKISARIKLEKESDGR